MNMKLETRKLSPDRAGYYEALNESCSPCKDEELGFELLTRVKGVKSCEINQKQLTNARLHVNHCKNPNREETFKSSEIMVVQSLTGIPSVLFWEARSLGYEPPKLMSAQKHYEHLAAKRTRLNQEISEIDSECFRLQEIIEHEVPAPTLIPVPGMFSASQKFNKLERTSFERFF